jgi:heme A synthase
MVYRSTNLYKTLAFLFFLLAVLIVLGSFALVTSVDFQAAFIVIGLFIFVISFSYFNLSRQENNGDTD